VWGGLAPWAAEESSQHSRAARLLLSGTWVSVPWQYDIADS
jgi:hypothetical protein